MPLVVVVVYAVDLYDLQEVEWPVGFALRPFLLFEFLGQLQLCSEWRILLDFRRFKRSLPKRLDGYILPEQRLGFSALPLLPVPFVDPGQHDFVRIQVVVY